jgi:hypothetical protein
MEEKGSEEKLENLETKKLIRLRAARLRRDSEGRKKLKGLKIWKLRINFQGRSYGSHISAGSQVSEPSLCLQTTIAPSQPMANPTIGEADSKSSSGISERGKANSIPAISV